jgi:hypothetical protein
LHTFVWRNWQLAPVKKLAKVVGAPKAAIIRMAKAMGLPPQSRITLDAERRSALTVIRRNWHLLPYEQLLALLEWTPEQLAFSLREDDFLYVKLGNLKPRCEPLVYATPGREVLAREQQIAATVRDEFGGGLPQIQDPLFGFVSRLSEKRSSARASRRPLPSFLLLVLWTLWGPSARRPRQNVPRGIPRPFGGYRRGWSLAARGVVQAGSVPLDARAQ